MKKIKTLSVFLVCTLFCSACNQEESTQDPSKIIINGYTNEVSISTDNDYRYIISNGIPDHEVGTFPNAADPVAITEIDLSYRMPLIPTELSESLITTGFEFGVAINGIPFDPNGPFYVHNNEMFAIRNPFAGIQSGWQYEGLSEYIDLGHDQNDAHVQPPGLYHYHGIPTLLIENLKNKQFAEMVLLGYAADGYPVYNNRVPSVALDIKSSLTSISSSYQLRQGERPANPSDLPQGPSGQFDGTFVQDYEYIEGLSELDQNNGRFGVTKEYPNGTYYYVITENWPYLPRYFKGEPDQSFRLFP